MKEAIQKAIDSGYSTKNKFIYLKSSIPDKPPVPATSIFLDPLFWQSLGKSLGWGNGVIWDYRIGNKNKPITEYLYHWHRFIDHLADGKDPESFFQELLNQK